MKSSYYCPFCGHQVPLEKLNERYLVCPECGVTLEKRLIDGSKLKMKIKGQPGAVKEIVEKVLFVEKTERRLQVAGELVKEFPNLSKKEKDTLIQCIGELIKETPGTTQAAMTVKKILAKIGYKAANIFRSILVDVISETAKRILWPPSF